MSKSNKLCSIEGCDRTVSGRNLCGMHYSRWLRNGHLDVVKRGNGEGNIRKAGYVYISKNKIRKNLHQWLAEKALGKPLPKGVEVHHFDGNPANNDPKNLIICPDHAYHLLLHKRTRALERCGNANWLPCHHCHEYDDEKNMVILPNKRQWAHVECRREYGRIRYAKTKPPPKPKIYSEERKQKIRLSKLNKPLSTEHKANISAGNKGKHNIPHTEETKKKLSLKRLEYYANKRLEAERSGNIIPKLHIPSLWKK